MSDEEIIFKTDNGLDALIQNEEDKRIVDPSKISVLDLINVFGEESVRRGLQYMASLEEADENYKNTDSNELLEGMKDWAKTDESTEKMKEMSNNWSKRMKEEGIGIE